MHYSWNALIVSLSSSQRSVMLPRTTWGITMKIWDSKQNCVWKTFCWNHIFLQLLRMREWFILILGIVYTPITWCSKMTSLFLRVETWYDIETSWSMSHWEEKIIGDVIISLCWLSKNLCLVCKLHRSHMNHSMVSSFVIISQEKSLVEIST